MKIAHCKIQNFRCFDSIDIDFDDRLTVLVAENGGGKTAVLDALRGLILQIEKTMVNRSHLFISDVVARDDFRVKRSNGQAPDELLDISISVDFSGIGQKKTDSGHISIEIDFNERLGSASFKEKSSLDEEYVLKKEIRFLFESAGDDWRTFILCYGAQRLTERKRGNVTREDNLTSIQQAYYGCSNGRIDFTSSFSWFNDHDIQESRTIKHTGDLSYRDPELEAVRQAITACLDGYENPRMSADVDSTFVISKVGEPNSAYSIEQLSDGYRAMLALVMDVARRMALANSEFCARSKCSVLESPAIILIDEIDLHLHPRWQQTVLPTLMYVFPQAQFIVTTHSPQVLTSVARKQIRVLQRVDGQWIAEMPVVSPLARESSDALAYVMDVDAYPPLHREKIRRYEVLVQAGQEDSDEAKALVREFAVLGLEIPDSDLTLWRFMAGQAE